MGHYVKLSPSTIHGKESRSWPAILSTAPHGPQWMDANYEAFAREGYKWNATVYACVNASVRSLRGVKFGVYKTKGSGKILMKGGPLAQMVKQPNNRQSWSSLIGEWTGSMEITGNAYLEGVSPDGPNADVLKRPPQELYVLRPDRVFVVPGDSRVPIAGYEYRAGSVIIPYRAQMWKDPRFGGFRPRCPILHSKYWNPTDDFYGLSPIQAAARNIDAFNSAVAWNVALTQNSARPGGIFSTDGTISASQAEEYANIIRQNYSGSAAAGRPMVLGMGLKWQQLGLNPADMDWIKGLEWNIQQIAAVFGIPPEILGDSANRTYSNYQEARKSVWMEKWLPMLDMFCEDLNNWLSPLFSEAYGDEVFVGYDDDAIEAIQEDRQIKWKNATQGTGFITIDEQRGLIGLDPRPNGEGDEILVPAGYVPLRVASKQTEMPAIAAARAKPKVGVPNVPGKPKPVLSGSRRPGGNGAPGGKKESLLLLEGIEPSMLEGVDELFDLISSTRASLATLEAAEDERP